MYSLVQVEQPVEEAVHDQQVLLAVRQLVRRRLALVDAHSQVGDVLAQRADALARHLLADEVGDQQPQQRLALERREGDRRPRVARSASRPLSVSE